MKDQFTLTTSNPIIESHQVFNQPLLPGLAYIDLIYQFIRDKGYHFSEIEIKNLSLYTPLVVQQDAIQLTISCVKENEKQWSLSVEGSADTEKKVLYATAQIVMTDSINFNERLTELSPTSSYEKSINLNEIYDICRKGGLVHDGIMKANGNIICTANYYLATIEVDKQYKNLATAFMFHPALLDGSAIAFGGALMEEDNSGQGLFLPIHFESFKANALINQKLYARIDRHSVRYLNELIIFSMEFFNEHGEKVGELKNLSNKLVRETGLRVGDRLPAKNGISKSSHTDTIVAKPDITAVQQIENYLTTLIARQLNLRVEEINPEGGYYELGLASRDLLEIVQQLGKKLDTTLPPTLLFEYTSISQLAAYFAQHHAKAFSDFPSETRTNAKQITTHTNSHQESSKQEVYMPPAQSDTEEIAIIGLAGRYPGADNIYEFWGNLLNGKDSITEIPSERWDWKIYDALRSPSGKKLSKWGGFINAPYSFDAPFFRISAREAEVMDPQERVLLEVCWEALEDSGCTPENLVKATGVKKRKPVGVFIGAMHKDYTVLGAQAVSNGEALPLSLNSSSISNRISYFCNFHGPSMTIDTACSSSLTALHQAILSIRCGESKAALVGGVNLSLHPAKYITYGLADMHSSDGRCNTFGKGGDGYVSSEGVGVVIIKSLQQAINDNDRIYAVVKGSSINHGGTVSGVTVPSPVAHTELITACLENAKVDPRTISYVEAHGTGTSLGDPIEIQGLAQAYQQFTSDNQFCAIGSVKSNMGHAEAAAGLCGLTKVILQLQNKKLVPSLHSEELNPYINFPQTPFFVQHKTEDWVNPVIQSNSEKITIPIPLRAGLSSFGATGTNVHIILEEYKSKGKSIQSQESETVIITLSAKNKERLSDYAGKLLHFLEKNSNESSARSNVSLTDIAYTLQLGRQPMEERVAFVVKDISGLKAKLTAFSKGEKNIDACFHGQINKHKDVLQHFNQDTAIYQLTKQWIEQNNLAKVAELWVNGLSVNWNIFYQHVSACKIGLPTYPFAKKNYTLTGLTESTQKFIPSNSSIIQTEPKSAKKGDILNDILYTPVWERQIGSLPLVDKKYNTILLVFNKQSETISQWVNAYLEKEKQGERIIRVLLSNKTGQLADKYWTCNVEDINALSESLSDQPAPDCVFFISINENPITVDASNKNLSGDEVQLLRLIKFFKKQAFPKNPIDAYILTADNFNVINSGIHPQGAGITGLAFAIAQGDFRFAVRNIDLALKDLRSYENIEKLMKQVLQEPSTSRGDVVKITEGIRYKQSLIKINSAGFASENGISKNGVYIILGGSGTVGEVITQHLISKYNAKIIWIGRKAAGSEYVTQKIASCSSGQNAPLYIQADATHPDDLKRALGTIKKSFPKINGAIFSGIIFNKDNSIDRTTETEFKEILEIKTSGSVNFYNMLKDEELDFMCFFSSSQAFSFSGAANFSAYTSGITFSDAYCKFIHQNSKFPVGIINWGFWKSTLKGISTENLSTKNIGLLEDEEGFACFENFAGLLQGGKLQQVVCMKTSEAVAQLMDMNRTEMVSLPSNKVESKIRQLDSPSQSGENIEAMLNSDEAVSFNNWIIKLLFFQLQKCGLFRTSTENVGTSDLRRKGEIIEKHERWVQEAMELLRANNYIKQEGDQFQVTEKGILVDNRAWDQWNEIKNSIGSRPDTQAQVQLIDNCFRNLPSILKGEVLATDVLFPNGSMSLVTGIYTGNKLADYFNNRLTQILKEYIILQLNDNPQRKIRIIEAGAGTGGTSSVLFPMLTTFKKNVEYVYTDVSRSFLHFAKEKFAQYDEFITYSLWDLGKEITLQNIQTNDFDIVIATNVFHATPDIRKTVRHAKSALAANGILLLNEGVGKSAFNTLTFGLLDGWWNYTDDYIRIPGSPLLNVESWNSVLAEEGFRQINFVPGKAENTGQKIIIAESDGLVRAPSANAKKLSADASGKDSSRKAAISTGARRQEANNKTERQSSNKHKGGVNEIIDGNIKDYVEDVLIRELSLALKASPDSIEKIVAFYEYGVDSIIGVTFINKVNELLNIKLNSAILFDYTTVEQLTQFIIETCSDTIMSSIKNTGSIVKNNYRQEGATVETSDKSRDQLHIIAEVNELGNLFFQDKISTESLLERISDQFTQN